MTAGTREGTTLGRGSGGADRSAARQLAIAVLLFVAVAIVLSALWPRPETTPTGHSSSWGAGAGDHRLLVSSLRILDHDADRHTRTYAALPPSASTLLVTIDPLSTEDLGKSPATAVDPAQRRALTRFVEAGGSWLVTATRGRAVVAFGREFARLESGGFGPDHVATELTRPPAVTDVAAVGPLTGGGPLAGFRGRLAATRQLAAVLPDLVRRDADGAPRIPAFEAPGPEWTAWLSLGDRPLVIARRIGAGQVILAATPLPFTHYGLVRLDLHEPVLRILHAASDRGTRRISFDAFAHGQVAARGTWWWAREMGLLHGIQAALLLIAVAAWRAAVRGRPAAAADDPPRRALDEFVAAQAGLIRRGGDRTRALDRLRLALDGRAGQRGDREAQLRIAAVPSPSGMPPDGSVFLSTAAALHRAAVASGSDPEPPASST